MKIMVWNIEKFTDEKLQNYDAYGPPGPLTRKRKRVWHSANERLTYMQNVFNAFGTAASAPDVIAILETMCDDNTAMGQPMPLNKSEGVINLIAKIKVWTGNVNWRVVPPLKCNGARPALHVGKWPAQEVVAVYYNSATVNFQGPDTRPAAVAPFYPAPWDQAGITNGTNRSGRVDHVDTAGATVYFPNVGNRSPFMVDFREVGGATRLMRCLFIHTSPGYQVGGTQAIANIAAMNPPPFPAPPGTPDYYIACGDFNVNDWHILGSTTGYNPYNPLQALNYQKQLGTANESTHFHRKGSGPHEPAQPAPNPLGYMQQQVIDNFLVRKTAGAAPAYVSNVINCVGGSPAPWNTAMGQNLVAINAIVGVPGRIATFREWRNFWCIIATSDHAPIYLQIP